MFTFGSGRWWLLLYSQAWFIFQLRFGVLGHGTKNGEILPRKVARLPKIVDLATGQSHVLAIDGMHHLSDCNFGLFCAIIYKIYSESFNLWVWGCGYFGRLGLGDTTHHFIPTMVCFNYIQYGYLSLFLSPPFFCRSQRCKWEWLQQGETTRLLFFNVIRITIIHLLKKKKTIFSCECII